MKKLSPKEQRDNLSLNITYLAGYFRSYALLSRLLRCAPKFVSRAINTPHELSLDSIDCASKTLGVDKDVLIGDNEVFKGNVKKWILDKRKFIEEKKNGSRKRKPRY